MVKVTGGSHERPNLSSSSECFIHTERRIGNKQMNMKENENYG